MCERKYWSDELVTPVHSLDYDFGCRTGHLNLPPGCNCDMGGCIELFQRIDPDVQLIRTYAGEKPDMVYRREHGTWQAYLPKRSNQEEKIK